VTNPYFRAFAKDNAWVITGQVLNFVKALVLTPLIIKTVGLGVFGTYVLILSLIGFIAGFSSCGTDFNYKRYFPAAHGNDRPRLFFPQFVFQLVVISAAGLLLLLLDLPLRTKLFKDGTAFSMGLVVAYIVSYIIYGQVANFFRYSNRMKLFIAATVTYPYLTIAFVSLWYWFYRGLTVDALIMNELFALLVVVAIFGFMLIREMGVAIPRFTFGELKDSMRHGFPLLMVSLNEFVMFSCVRFIIAFFLTVQLVGSFAAAVQLGSLMLFFPKASGVALPPLLCKAADSGDSREARMMLRYAVKGYLLVAIPFVVVCIVSGKQLLSLFASAAASDAAWVVTPIVSAAILFYGLNLIVSNLNVVLVNTKILMRANLVASALSIVFNIVMIGIFKSIFPAALTMLLCYTIVFAMINRSLPEDWSVDYDIQGIARVGLASVFGAVSGGVAGYYLAIAGPAVSFAISLALGGTSYIIFLFLFRVITKDEITFARGLVHPRAT